MSESESRSTTVASSPGTSLPDLLGISSLLHADIILRSSDSHDFQVQRVYVVDSSPVLKEQIMAVSTCHGVGLEATTVDGGTDNKPLVLPVIQLAESRTSNSALLTFVFHVPPILPPTVEEILDLLSMAQKYEMTAALIRIRDCASRRDSPFICLETAFRVYSIAHKYGLLEKDFEDKLDILTGAALSDL
ncbi:hypothetical protein EDB87DRAFT_943205 [Lactarius vividus]|nr:hypothetical protein EDB87DRAFT_943205 [Lactarius vividus]